MKTVIGLMLALGLILTYGAEHPRRRRQDQLSWRRKISMAMLHAKSAVTMSRSPAS